LSAPAYGDCWWWSIVGHGELLLVDGGEVVIAGRGGALPLVDEGNMGCNPLYNIIPLMQIFTPIFKHFPKVLSEGFH
jgi:hypothetical protein